jgi:transmembrane sensor
LKSITMSEADFAGDTAAQARAWLVHLRSGKATRADALAFRKWCAEHPEHAHMAESVNDMWSVLQVAVAEFEQRQDASDSAAVRVAERLRGLRPGRRAFVGFAVAAGASWLALRPPLQLWPAISEFAADYRTGTGEQRQIALSDRVLVAMNTQTQINILASGQTSSHGIRLLAGEAEITATAPAVGRTTAILPVVVVAGPGRLQAQVARFDVRRTGEQVCVTCVSGAVAVEHRRQHLTLLANQQLIYDDRDLRIVSDVNPDSVVAWRQGLLVFDRVPLAQVVDEINRYRHGKLILRNAALGQRLVKAQLPIATLDDAVAMIRDAYGAHVTELPGNIVLLG